MDGQRLVVRVEIREAQSVRPHSTIQHEPIPRYVEVSMTGAVYEGRRDVGGGQCHRLLRDIADRGAPGKVWDRNSLLRASALWQRWHLNGMRAACAHMPADAYQRWNQGEVVECAEGHSYREDGRPYRYGEAWLVEVVPEAVLAEVVGLVVGNREDRASKVEAVMHKVRAWTARAAEVAGVAEGAKVAEGGKA